MGPMPKVMMLLDKDKRPYKDMHTIDLSAAGSEHSIRKGLAPGAYGVDIEEVSL